MFMAGGLGGPPEMQLTQLCPLLRAQPPHQGCRVFTEWGAGRSAARIIRSVLAPVGG